jgi:hypothetical protein
MMEDPSGHKWIVVSHDRKREKVAVHLKIVKDLMADTERYTGLLLINLSECVEIVRGAKAEPLERKDIKDITRLSVRDIAMYTEWPKESPVIVPDYNGSPGRGKPRKYSKRNLLQFLIARECAVFGMTVGKIKYVIEQADALMKGIIKI